MTTPTNKPDTWQKFICRACGYIYDEELGDPEDGLPAGTRFADIPNDWVCPLCGVRKSDFEPYVEDEVSAFVPTFDRNVAGVVIIGAGLAGWSVVDAIRALDNDIAITLITADSGDRYHKPMLSVAISQGKTLSDLVRTTGDQAAKISGIHLLAYTYVTHIDSQTSSVHTTRGNIGYRHLVLAIGASPAYPPSIDRDKAWHVNNLDRFTQLQARLDAPKHIAIVGAGMIGVEMTEDLVKAGHRVSLIDMQRYPMSALLPQLAGERILDALMGIGVAWHGECGVTDVDVSTDGYVLNLDHADGEGVASTLVADEIIVATGLVIDERLPVRAGVTYNRQTGIAVNPQTLQTSQPHIYALGDCISIDGIPCRYVAPHRAQANAIAHEILALPHTGYIHKPPMIRLKNKTISVTANGNPKGAGDWRIVSDDGGELVIEMLESEQSVAKATIKAMNDQE